MTQSRRHYADIHDYIAGLTEEERHELAAADMALHIASLVHDARTAPGPRQARALPQAELQRHLANYLERTRADIESATLHKYLQALGGAALGDR